MLPFTLAARPSRSILRFALLLLLACGGVDESSSSSSSAGLLREPLVTVPAQGTSSTLDIGEWNLDWFGATQKGPTDEALQLSNVHDVILGANLDIWGLEEVVSATQFNQLVSGLSGYAGLLANDPSVTSGASFYSTAEQKVALVYKTSIATVHSAKLIVTDQASNFGGRPPLEVSMTVKVNRASAAITLIVLHAKAYALTNSYNERVTASTALKAYLDSAHPSDRVIVIGDFNDDVDKSITTGRASPYANFVNDTAGYFFATKALEEAGQHSTVAHSGMIDHHLLTDEAVPLYQAGSATVFLVNQFIEHYGTTTTDHFPTYARYKLGASAKVVLNEILADEPGNDGAAEFIELVNTGGASADLSGFTLSDAASVRHTFPSGTTLVSGGSLVVFGGASGIPAGLTNASAASTGTLSLNNGGDTVTLKDGAGNVVDTFAYASSLSSTDGVSMNSSPDATATGTFVLHTSLVSAASSPGMHADGSAFAK